LERSLEVCESVMGESNPSTISIRRLCARCVVGSAPLQSDRAQNLFQTKQIQQACQGFGETIQISIEGQVGD
jgi:hypothetical protein